jgi:tripartite-type tricarboxylate transporter receptor subunit TctC
MQKIHRVRAFALAAGLVVAGSAFAQAFPSKPLRIIVPFPAGGVVDILARSVADGMSPLLGQPIVVEAKPGADSAIGTEDMLRQPADGHTLLMASPNIVTGPNMISPPKWDYARDVQGVAYVASVPNVAVVPVQLGVADLKAFVALAKSKPRSLNYASPGNGTSNHLGTELMQQVTGIELTKINYKGQPPAIPDLLNGNLQFKLLTMSLAVPHVTSGKLKALAVAADKRTRALPDVPTFAEAGFPDVRVVPWFGLVARRGVPTEVVARLNDAARKALATPEVIARIEKANGEVAPAMSAAEWDRFLLSESQRFGALIKARGIKSE